MKTLFFKEELVHAARNLPFPSKLIGQPLALLSFRPNAEKEFLQKVCKLFEFQNSVVDSLPAGLQTGVVVICQQMLALDDLGGGSCSAGCSVCLFCTTV